MKVILTMILSLSLKCNVRRHSQNHVDWRKEKKFLNVGTIRRTMPHITVETLTPLWTGDINGKCSKIKETSIIGSLRWWYEALVRGLDGSACDPTGGNRCPSPEDGSKNRCDVCEFFGCTDWSRRFSLRVEKSPGFAEMKFLSRIEHESFYYNRKGRRIPTDLSNWYKLVYQDTHLQAFFGGIELAALSHSSISNQHINDIVAFLLKLISAGGGIGAKSQIGFGLINLKNEKEFDLREGFRKIKSIKGSRDSLKKETLEPCLNDYFKLEVVFPTNFLENKGANWYPRKPDMTQSYLQLGFAFKFLIRNAFKKDDIAESICTNYSKISEESEKRKKRVRDGNERNAKKEIKRYNPEKIVVRSIFGSDLVEKWASLVYFSDAFKEQDSYKMRIWGFIPKYTEFDEFRCEIDKKLLVEKIREIIECTFSGTNFTRLVFGKDILHEVVRNEL
jgi:CRISPR-associated protein Cmr1